MQSKKRYGLLDLIRGLTLISMICFHACWDLVFLYGQDWNWYRTSPGYIWQQSICWSFIFLSGFCWRLGKNHLRRGAIVFAGGLVITIITELFLYDSRVVFGILTFLGSAMILLQCLDRFLKIIPSAFGIALSGVLFFLCRNVNRGNLGFEKIIFFDLPDWIYQNLFTTYLGFPHQDFFSTDYFSLMPWFFLFLAGYYFYDIMERKQWISHLDCEYGKVFQWIGKHSLEIYMLHQPILFGVFSLIFAQGR